MKQKLPIIRRSILVMLFVPIFSWGMYAQNFTVRGVVADSDGNPLPGVTVIEVGTQNGTVSDLSGEFSILVGEEAQLQFSMLSYRTLILPAQSNGFYLTWTITISRYFACRNTHTLHAFPRQGI